MPIVLPVGVSPGSPATYEYVNQFAEQVAAATPANALTAHGAAISNATTNTALVTVPASITAGATAGSVFLLKAGLVISAPASAGATLAFNAYSGGSGGTALATMTAFTPTASLSSALCDLEMWVTFWSVTTVQCLVKATISSSTTTAAASLFLAGNASATPVTVTASNTLTLNAVMGSAVSGSSYEAISGYYTQES